MTCHLCIHELYLMLKVFVVYKCMRDDCFPQGCFAVHTVMPCTYLLFLRKP